MMEASSRMRDVWIFATGMLLYPFRMLTLDGKAIELLNRSLVQFHGFAKRNNRSYRFPMENR